MSELAHPDPFDETSYDNDPHVENTGRESLLCHSSYLPNDMISERTELS